MAIREFNLAAKPVYKEPERWDTHFTPTQLNELWFDIKKKEQEFAKQQKATFLYYNTAYQAQPNWWEIG